MYWLITFRYDFLVLLQKLLDLQTNDWYLKLGLSNQRVHIPHFDSNSSYHEPVACTQKKSRKDECCKEENINDHIANGCPQCSDEQTVSARTTKKISTCVCVCVSVCVRESGDFRRLECLSNRGEDRIPSTYLSLSKKWKEKKKKMGENSSYFFLFLLINWWSQNWGTIISIYNDDPALTQIRFFS